jgi:thymidylate kinase
LDIDPALGLERAQDPNRFEAEGVEFQKKVRAGFLRARKEEPKRWLTLKVQDRTPVELSATVLKSMKTRFKQYFQVSQK